MQNLTFCDNSPLEKQDSLRSLLQIISEFFDLPYVWLTTGGPDSEPLMWAHGFDSTETQPRGELLSRLRESDGFLTIKDVREDSSSSSPFLEKLGVQSLFVQPLPNHGQDPPGRLILGDVNSRDLSDRETHRLASFAEQVRVLLDRKVESGQHSTKTGLNGTAVTPSKAEISKRVTDAIVEVNEDWEFITVDPRAEEIYEMTEEQLLGQNFWSVFPGAINTPFEREYRRAMETREPTTVEAYFDTLESWFRVRTYPESHGGLSFYFQDTTEHKSLQQELEDQKNYLTQILNAATNAIMVKNADLEFELVNDALTKYMNRSREELIGKTLSEVFPGALSQETESIHQNVLWTGEPIVNEEQPFEHPVTGEILWFDERNVPIHPEAPPEDRKLLVVATDITEQKRVRDEVERNLKFREAINRQLPGVVFRFQVTPDGEYSFPYMSDGSRELSGRNPDLIMEEVQAAFDAIHPEDREQFFRGVEESRRELSEWDEELRFVHPDGSVKWVWGRSMPEELDDGTVQWSGVMIDITERKQTEKQLREAEQRFRQLAENIDAVFWIYDLENDEVSYVSPQYEEIWERSREPFNEDPFAFVDAVIPEDRRKAKQTHERITGDFHDIEYRIETPDADVKWIRDRGFPIEDDSGRVVRIAGLAEDVTRKKEREKQLQTALDQKQALLQEVHHRVKNNMQVISSLLNLEAQKSSSSALETTLQECRNRIQAMALVHRHLYENQQPSETVDLRMYLEDLARATFESMNGQTVDVTLDVTLPEKSVHTDMDTAIPLGLCVNELITNAVQHAFEDGSQGTISLDVEWESNDSILIQVIDDGIGLPDDFELDKGSSLGFQLVRSLTESQLHGSLEFESEEGTRVALTLPEW